MKYVILLLIILMIAPIAATDTQVWQGKYLTGNDNTEYNFNFSVYDSLVGGNICYSNEISLTTDSNKWWSTYQDNVAGVCDNASVDYYINIEIDNVDQFPRRFLKHLKYADLSQDNIYLAGNLSVKDLAVRSGSSITLAGATFENEGTYTSVSTDFGVHNDIESTAFLGIYAHNNSAFTHANFVMEAGSHGLNSGFNIVKNGPLHPFSPNSSGILNEGNHGTFVPHENQITWYQYSNLTKDVFGNIVYLYDMQRLMMLNDSHLTLEEVDLLVNGSVSSINIENSGNITSEALRIHNSSWGSCWNGTDMIIGFIEGAC